MAAGGSTFGLDLGRLPFRAGARGRASGSWSRAAWLPDLERPVPPAAEGLGAAATGAARLDTTVREASREVMRRKTEAGEC